MFQLVSVFVSWYTKQTSDYSKARKQSLRSELKVLMTNIMAYNTAEARKQSLRSELKD